MATRVGYVGTEIIGAVLTKANFDKGPGGLIGYATNNTNGTAATGTNTPILITGLSLTPTFNTSRIISVYVGVAAFSIQSAATTSDLCVYDVSGSAVIGSVQATSTQQGFPIGVPGASVTAIVASPASSRNYAGAMLINGGVGTVQPQGAATGGVTGTRNNVIFIRDEGPAF